MSDDPFHAQLAAVDQHHDDGSSRFDNTLGELLAESRQRDVRPVAILAAGLVVPVVAQRMFADYDDGQIRFPRGRDGFVHFGPAHSADVPPLVDKGEFRGRRLLFESFQNGRHVLFGLGQGPVAQDGLVVGVGSGYQNPHGFGRVERENPVVGQQYDGFDGRLVGGGPVFLGKDAF